MNQITKTNAIMLSEVTSGDKIESTSSQLEDISKHDIFGFQMNEDICFKCKKVGQIYCCDNCFRSYHWKCIGDSKIRELTESSYVINFVCESCDQQSNCIKCNQIYPEQKFNLLDFSQESSIFTIYKCTHCYSKIHKKCLDIPLQILTRKLKQKQSIIKSDTQVDTFQHHICSKCLQNIDITEIITTQKVCNNLGIQNLYFYVLLNTNSPVHKGWVEEYALRNHLKKFSGNRTFVSEFLKNKRLYEQPQIQKILAIRFPVKYKKTSISEVLKIIQSRNKPQLNSRYGEADNFKFLVKWKQRDYTSLTWQDQMIITNQLSVLKTFLSQKQNQCCLIQHVNQIQSKRNLSKSFNETNYKILEYFLNNQSKITSKLLQKKPQIDIQDKNSERQIQQKISELDQNNDNSYLEIIEIQCNKSKLNKEVKHINIFIKYLTKCYRQKIILRPTLIISDSLQIWQKSIKNFQNINQLKPLEYVKFQGSKLNTDSLKSWSFFISKNPTLLKFQIVLINYNYFLYENKFLFDNISQFFVTFFDQPQRAYEAKQKLKFIEKAYIPFKSKIYKEIHLIEDSLKLQQKQNFIMSLLNFNNTIKNPIKKCIYHDLNFYKIKEYLHSESNLKLKLEKRYKDSAKIFDSQTKQILNQGQRLSFLKFIMAFGLNIKKIDDMCNRMRTSNPSIWNSIERKKVSEVVKDYLSLFMAVMSNNSKQPFNKKYETNLNYFLFNYQKEAVMKRIIQLKKLKTEIEKSYDDHSKFIVKKPFMFFSSGQCKPFPLWNTYEDYTLGALIVEEGYQMWDNVINSKKWIDYHSQLQTRKIYQLDAKTGTFSVQQKIVPIKKKVAYNFSQNEQRIIQHISLKIVQESKIQHSRFQEESGKQQQPSTYGEYLLKKIRGSKQFKQFQYARLDDLNILQGHIAERGDSILLSLIQQ